MLKIKVYSNDSTDITSVDAVKLITADSFSYDVMGRLTKTGGYEFTYDAAGRLTQSKDGFGRAVSYEYTLAGRRSKLIWPDGFYVTYGYDAVGRLDNIWDCNNKPVWSCSYDTAGRRTQTTGVHGLTTDYDYEDVENNDNRGTYLEGLTNNLGGLSLSTIIMMPSAYCPIKRLTV